MEKFTRRELITNLAKTIPFLGIMGLGLSGEEAAFYDSNIDKFSGAAEVSDIITQNPWVDVRALGAVGDGGSHPLSTKYATINDAQAIYPHATALTNEIDWCAIQMAINNYTNILIPHGSYKLSAALVINRNGVHISGGEDGMYYTKLSALGASSAFIIQSGHRNITISDLNIFDGGKIASVCAGIDISKGSGAGGSAHFLTFKRLQIERFGCGISTGRDVVSGADDDATVVWNCKFEDIKINARSLTDNAYGIVMALNNVPNFCIEFNGVYVNGFKYPLRIAGTKAQFNSCNFGISAINAIHVDIHCNVVFDTCNFECDYQVTGKPSQAIILLGSRLVTFTNCTFKSWTDANTSFIILLSANNIFVTLKSCHYERANAGDLMANFWNLYSVTAKYSIVFAGGNYTIPRPTPSDAFSLQFLDLERSVLPIKTATSRTDTLYLGEAVYDTADHKPKWWNGTKFVDALNGIGYTTVPASATATGTAGQWSADTSYFYVCIATNTWKRIALSTW
jgi:hypothetical protein